MPEHRRHPWHRYYLHATTGHAQDDGLDYIEKALVQAWNEDPPLYMTRRGAKRALRLFEDMLPVRLYVRELD